MSYIDLQIENEIWLPVKGYEGSYQVSNYGRIKSLLNNKESILKPCLTNGYYIVNLCRRLGKRKNAKIHRVVAEAFILNPEDKDQVNHIDGDKSNNHLVNLEWSTRSENLKHAYAKGLAKPHYKYPSLQVKAIAALKRAKFKNAEIASVLHISINVVDEICKTRADLFNYSGKKSPAL